MINLCHVSTCLRLLVIRLKRRIVSKCLHRWWACEFHSKCHSGGEEEISGLGLVSTGSIRNHPDYRSKLSRSRQWRPGIWRYWVPLYEIRSWRLDYDRIMGPEGSLTDRIGSNPGVFGECITQSGPKMRNDKVLKDIWWAEGSLLSLRGWRRNAIYALNRAHSFDRSVVSTSFWDGFLFDPFSCHDVLCICGRDIETLETHGRNCRIWKIWYHWLVDPLMIVMHTIANKLSTQDMVLRPQ